MKFEGDWSNSLEVEITKAQQFGKAIRPLFADLVMGYKTILTFLASLLAHYKLSYTLKRQQIKLPEIVK